MRGKQSKQEKWYKVSQVLDETFWMPCIHGKETTTLGRYFFFAHLLCHCHSIQPS